MRINVYSRVRRPYYRTGNSRATPQTNKGEHPVRDSISYG